MLPVGRPTTPSTLGVAELILQLGQLLKKLLPITCSAPLFHGLLSLSAVAI